jgi:hypothetical protein
VTGAHRLRAGQPSSRHTGKRSLSSDIALSKTSPTVGIAGSERSTI